MTEENSEKHLLLQRIEQFNLSGGNVIEAKLRMTELQSGQLSRLMDDLKCWERDSRFEWTWVEISLYNDSGEITHALRPGIKSADWDEASSANRMHLIAKRTLKPIYKPMDVYNALMRPAPVPRPPVSAPPVVVQLGRTKKKNVSSSESDSDSTFYSSDSSVGNVRRRLRRYRARKARNGICFRRGSFYSDSESDSDEEADIIQIKLKLKRGDDVVKALLEMWTPEA